ncbi:MAG: PQQ-binding-like beta-propeller repeat protein [Pirellulaceae bacterium]|nr:PQQ-binding-like beta-propeller repeat protein [Pirellulaceae bacterium]
MRVNFAMRPGQILPACLLLMIGCPLVMVQAADWPQWRGPQRNGMSLETDLLSQWPAEGLPVLWKSSQVGGGYASVVVSKGMLFTIGQQGQDVLAVALDAVTGKQHWSQEIGKTSRTPCSTPTVDGNRLYALDPDGNLVCMKTVSGEIVWKRAFLKDFQGRMMSGRGYGESPLIDGDKLICSPGGAEHMMVALNKYSGELIWKTQIPDLGMAGRDGMGFSSAQVTTAAGIRQYIQLVGRGLIGVAADDGRFLWGYNDISNGTANIPTPIVRGDLVFSANGYNSGSVLLKLHPRGQGGVQVQQVYRLNGSRFQNHHGGVILVEDAIFGGHGSNNGLPTSLDLQTGRQHWKRRGPGVGSAAVVYADGHLYFRYQNGVMALVEATTKGYRLKGKFQIPGAGGDSWAHPVVANGRLYLREKNTLFVYDVRDRDQVANTGPEKIDWPGPLGKIQQLGVELEPVAAYLERTRSRKHEQLYGELEDLPKQRQGPVLVTLQSRHLAIDGSLQSEVLQLLEAVSRPLVLNLAGTRISSYGIEQLSGLKSLHGLNLELCPGADDDAVKQLSKASALRVLGLMGVPVTEKGLESLQTLKNLRSLDLEICEQIGDTGCTVLAGFPALRVLVLKKTAFEPIRVTDAGLEKLATLTQLRVLNLYANNISDQGLVHLGRLSKLRQLDLSLTAITDAGLVHLEKLSGLTHLDLLYSNGFAGPIITGAGVKSLAGLESLQSLSLVGARINDESLQLPWPKTLRSLHLANTAVTEQGVSRLKKRIPECKVIR